MNLCLNLEIWNLQVPISFSCCKNRAIQSHCSIDWVTQLMLDVATTHKCSTQVHVWSWKWAFGDDVQIGHILEMVTIPFLYCSWVQCSTGRHRRHSYVPVWHHCTVSTGAAVDWGQMLVPQSSCEKRKNEQVRWRRMEGKGMGGGSRGKKEETKHVQMEEREWQGIVENHSTKPQSNATQKGGKTWKFAPHDTAAQHHKAQLLKQWGYWVCVLLHAIGTAASREYSEHI